MINASDITPDQLNLIQGWANEGLDLNEMQKRINGDLHLNATYMETRFLLMDLGIELSSPKKEESKEQEATPAQTPVAPESMLGKTIVTIDEITPPHAIISGKVTFKSGCQGTWYFDKMGRIDWEPIGAEPSEEDLMDFQKELQKVLRQQMGGM